MSLQLYDVEAYTSYSLYGSYDDYFHWSLFEHAQTLHSFKIINFGFYPYFILITFPEFCGIRTQNCCNSRAVSYQLKHEIVR